MRRVIATPWSGVVLGLVGLANLAALVVIGDQWEASSEPLRYVPLVIGQLATAGLLILGPWVLIAVTRLGGDHAIRRIMLPVVVAIAAVTSLGVGFAVGAAVGGATTEDRGASAEMASQIGSMTLAVAFLLALAGLIVGPWMLSLTRRASRERTARVRAEERAEVAAHLHDSVLQALTLIQKRSSDGALTSRVARRTERELRNWLFNSTTVTSDDLAGALRAAVADIENHYDVTVEMVASGTCRLDERVRAVVGAARESLTNAAKHSGVQTVSMFAEATDSEVVVIIRDRGAGFSLHAPNGGQRRGVRDSIVERMQRHGGTATIQTARGVGTEVELRMPAAGTA